MEPIEKSDKYLYMPNASRISEYHKSDYQVVALFVVVCFNSFGFHVTLIHFSHIYTDPYVSAEDNDVS